jgi:hypothetical protein
MLTMNKKTASAVTLGVWIAALGAAGALAYTLNRAPHWPDAARQVAPPVAALAPEVVAEPTSGWSSVLYVPAVTIVGHVQRPRASAPTLAPATDIARMHCTDWRGLDIGSGRVQVCQ